MSGTIIICPACQTQQRPGTRRQRDWRLYGIAPVLVLTFGIVWLLVPPRDKGPSPSPSPARTPTIVVPKRPEVASNPSPKPVESRPIATPIVAANPGRELFFREWIPDDPRSHGGDGLGPVFNDSSCIACHNLGGAGGGGPNSKNVDILSLSHRGAQQQRKSPKADRRDDPIAEDLHPGFRTAGSVVLHRFGIAPEYASWRMDRLGTGGGLNDPFAAKNVRHAPPEVFAKLEIERSHLSVVRRDLSGGAGLSRSQRNPTALFGAGAIDAIPDQAIREAARRSYPEFPKVTGRVSLQEGGRIGRFGWKAQVPTLREFVVTACAVELGLECPGQPQGGDPTDLDVKAPGLDLNDADCDALIAFVRSLPAPVQQASSDEAGSSAIKAGRELFLSIGCGTCHSPELGTVDGIYSDLLLHDMGPETSDTGSYRMFRPESPGSDQPKPDPSEGDRPREPRPEPGGATPREWRTPPLWGLRDSAPYLHDGRAETLEQAIALHGGEGEDPANRYFGLSPRRRQQVQAFLKSLVAPVAPPPL